MVQLHKSLVCLAVISVHWVCLSTLQAAGTPEEQKPLAVSTSQPAVQSPVVSIEVFPKELSLVGRHDARSILVTGVLADGGRLDLTSEANVQPQGAAVRFEGGYFVPASDGESTVTIQARGQQVQIPVKV